MRSDRANEIARYVGTRTVYPYSQIEAMCSKPVLAIKFRLVRLLKAAIPLSDMLGQNILAGAPQSITKLDGATVQWLRDRMAL